MKSSELRGELEASQWSQSQAAAGSAIGRPKAGEARGSTLSITWEDLWT